MVTKIYTRLSGFKQGVQGAVDTCTSGGGYTGVGVTGGMDYAENLAKTKAQLIRDLLSEDSFDFVSNAGGSGVTGGDEGMEEEEMWGSEYAKSLDPGFEDPSLMEESVKIETPQTSSDSLADRLKAFAN